MNPEPMLTVTYEVPLSECRGWAHANVADFGRLSPAAQAMVAAYRKWEAENQRFYVVVVAYGWGVEDRNNNAEPVAKFVEPHPNPKEAAEAEAARLNEQERGK